MGAEPQDRNDEADEMLAGLEREFRDDETIGQLANGLAEFDNEEDA